MQGKRVGYARNVNGSEEYVFEDLEVLDNIETEENVVIGYRCSMGAEFARIVGESLRKAGWFPAGGKSPEERLRNVLTSGELTAQIEDTKTGTILYQYQEVKAASRNFAINARGIVGVDVQFVAIRMLDETEV
jgi:hypothetical protein